MNTEKHSIALSRALFELRSGRSITLGTLSFQPVEGNDLPVGGTLIAPDSLDERFLPNVARVPETAEEKLAITLLKRAGLLPALAQMEAAEMSFSVADIEAGLSADSSQLQEVARARLPIKAVENAQVVSFRSPSSAMEHLAVVIGDPQSQEAPLVRVHSSCITGDLLGSLRCDCGDQLHLALEQIGKAGHGVICYLQQEGRGIGISNKIRAYALQDEGQDTLDANLALGFAADERDFGLAAAMLKLLGVEAITLLSNNPDKSKQLAQYGIQIAAQEALIADANSHNAGYLDTKAKRFGHKLDN
ncbi:MAG: GTP cyclohydrolase II [Rickettsiales bacterium]|nr:GTP cyclohydrolase II [Rickettsiales bacterium]